MPTVSGQDLISDTTEKSIRRTVVVSAIAVLLKAYAVPLDNFEALGIQFPAALIDVILLALVVHSSYSLTVNWVGDLMAFRLWYRESSIWSNFGTKMELDKSFIEGSIPLILKLHALEKGHDWPCNYADLDESIKEEYNDFRTNVELYVNRLENAGTKFSALSTFAHFYVWFQSFIFPIVLSIGAIYLLLKYGDFALPPNL